MFSACFTMIFYLVSFSICLTPWFCSGLFVIRPLSFFHENSMWLNLFSRLMYLFNLYQIYKCALWWEYYALSLFSFFFFPCKISLQKSILADVVMLCYKSFEILQPNNSTSFNIFYIFSFILYLIQQHMFLFIIQLNVWYAFVASVECSSKFSFYPAGNRKGMRWILKTPANREKI